VKSAAILLILVMFWAVGLLAFSARIAKSTPAEDPDPAQAVVVLTGAATQRITEAVKLLEIGKGERLLVSGVNPDATRKDIKDVSKATQRMYDCCVDLGFKAEDTRGNAQETAAWSRSHGYSDLLVVTADYHMPRAILAPYPVKTAELDAANWWKTSNGARRMILEYCKYLAILAREGFLSLGPDAPPRKAPA